MAEMAPPLTAGTATFSPGQGGVGRTSTFTPPEARVFEGSEEERTSNYVLYSEQGMKGLIHWRDSLITEESWKVKNLTISLAASFGVGLLSLTALVEGVVRGVLGLIILIPALMRFKCAERRNADLKEAPQAAILYGVLGSCYMIKLLAFNTKANFDEALLKSTFPILSNVVQQRSRERSRSENDDMAGSDSDDCSSGGTHTPSHTLRQDPQLVHPSPPLFQGEDDQGGSPTSFQSSPKT